MAKGACGVQPLQDGDPRRIGRYQVLARIGEGGMGRVFLGESDSGRRVALKVVHPDLARSSGFRERFAREIAAARTVGGFWTAAVVDADADADLPWLATEYIPGPSLHQYVQASGPLPIPGLRALAMGLCEAVAAIHRAGLIHRDLKPTNVLLLPDGPRVIDFGISRALDQTPLTTTRHTMGTPGFMAPEQIQHGQVSAASDVFGIGLILVFAATGRPLYGGDFVHFAYQVVHGEPDLRDIPTELRSVVAQCLVKEPAERPSALEVLDSLAGTPSVPSPGLPAGWGSADLTSRIVQGAGQPELTPHPDIAALELSRATEPLPVRPSVYPEPEARAGKSRRRFHTMAMVLTPVMLLPAALAWFALDHPAGKPSVITAAQACGVLTGDQVRRFTGIEVARTEGGTSGDGAYCQWYSGDVRQTMIMDITLINATSGKMSASCTPWDQSGAPSAKIIFDAQHDTAIPDACSKGGVIEVSNGREAASFTLWPDMPGHVSLSQTLATALTKDVLANL